MSRRSRKSEQEMNFDGLADSVTNLVGALILVVIIVIGVTGDAVSQPPPAPKTAVQGGGQRSAEPLQHRLAALRAQLQATSQETSELNEKLNGLRADADSLFEKVDQLQPPPIEPKDEAAARPKIRDILYRPPFEQESNKDAHQFWVQGNRIVRMQKFKDLCNEIDAAFGKREGKVKVELNIWDGNFVLEGEAVLSGGNFGRDNFEKSQLSLRLHPEAVGETAEQLTQPDSQFRRLLTSSNPKEAAVTFEVLPDSFETYRLARQIAWDQEFDVGWEPLLPGEPMRFGVGSTRTQ